MMPPVSPCGLVVDFVRSCIRGKWKLYPSRPDILTDAFLYFAEEGTPAIRSLHPFGSANWNKDKNVYPPLPVGQDYYAGAEWYNGDPPENVPPNFLPWPDSLLSEPMQPGLPPANRGYFDARCFTVFHPGIEYNPDHFLNPDITDCCWQRVLARLLQLLVEPDPLDLLEFSNAIAMLWPDAQIFVDPGNEVQDRIAFVQMAERNIVFRVGTQHWMEIFTQVFHLNQRAVEIGGIATSVEWWNQSTADIEFLDDNDCDYNLPTWFIGHSRGGAINWLTARRLTDPFPNRRMEVLTFGVPKVGDLDATLRGNIRFARHVIHQSDPIPLLPPRQPLWEFLIPLYGLVNFNAMGDWQPFAIYQQVGGGRRPRLTGPPDLPWETFAEWIGLLLQGQAPDPVAQHYMSAYVAALAACCSRPVFPFTDELWRTLFGLPDNAAGGNIVNGGGDYGPKAPIGGVKLDGGGGGLVGGGGLLVGGGGVVVYTSPASIILESGDFVLLEAIALILLE